MTEDQLEQETLGWLTDVGYTVVYGVEIAPDKVNGEAGEGALGHGNKPERSDYRQVVLVELKNPADKAADIWKAYDKIETYKEQIPDVFQYDEVLVISDGTEAKLGSLSSNGERFMQWRTIDGVTLDPLGQFNELETLIRGVLAPAYLLDYGVLSH